jgi:hypothetical protein
VSDGRQGGGVNTRRMDQHRAAIEAEADRLFGVYLRIRALAQRRGLDFLAAGAWAVRHGMETAEDWDLVREAVGGG